MSSERGNKQLKLIDRYLGIPVVFILGLIKRKKNLPAVNNIKSVAFLKTAAIGDTILMSASINDLKVQCSDIQLTMFTSEANYEIAEMLPGIDRIVKLPVKKPLEAVRLIRNAGEFDVWIDFGAWPRINAFLSFFSKSDCIIGFKTNRQYKHYVFDIAINHSPDIHEAYNYKNLLKPLGIIGNSLPAITRRDCCKNDDRAIVVHIYSGGEKHYLKEWPDEYWIDLIGHLTASGYKVCLTGSDADKEKAFQLKERVKLKKLVEVVAGQLSLKETADLLLSALLVISVDTGILHLASGLDCKLIALHGPTSFKKWGALSKNAISVQSTFECSPCLTLGFDSDCTNNKCMRAITIDEVKKAINKILLPF